ncbi:tripartite tricarboxylate transporter substrate binding protein [Nisaea sp.]|uniref:Bug family tripartite tricarboxylate transporter substrate binding protein n=1 Tax=Nisaea sp. TaxID=2024842 RepID=UPI0032657C1B
MPNHVWNNVRRTLTGLALGGLALMSAGTVMAQEFPNKPVTLVVGFPPGGSTDVVARILAENMTKTLGQPVLVENRPGAGGTVGISHVARSAPDGYTLGVSGVGASILIAALGRDTGYDIDKDLDIIGVMGTLGLVIAGRTGMEPKTLPELMQFAKDHPGDLTYGSSGVGTPGHLAMEYLKSISGVDILHIPYKGNTPLMNDVLGGHVDIALLTTPGTAEQVRAGGVYPYAVTSPERSSLMPQVPTVIEGGFDGYTATLWNLLVTPKGTPEDVQAKLSDALNAAMQDGDVLAAYKKSGLAPTSTTPEQATQFLVDERSKWQGVIAKAGVKK